MKFVDDDDDDEKHTSCITYVSNWANFVLAATPHPDSDHAECRF